MYSKHNLTMRARMLLSPALLFRSANERACSTPVHPSNRSTTQAPRIFKQKLFAQFGTTAILYTRKSSPASPGESLKSAPRNLVRRVALHTLVATSLRNTRVAEIRERRGGPPLSSSKRPCSRVFFPWIASGWDQSRASLAGEVRADVEGRPSEEP